METLINGHVYDGARFNTIMNDTTFYKVLNKEEIHNGFKYVPGLNIDVNPFNPSGTCESGGLYFIQYYQIHKYWLYGNGYRIVTIPNDAQVYIDGLKFKADKIILGDQKFLFADLIENDEKFVRKILSRAENIGLVGKKTWTLETLCKAACAYSIKALKFVPHRFQTPELWMKYAADAESLKDVPEEYITYDMVKMILQTDPTIIKEHLPFSLNYNEIVRINGLALGSIPPEMISQQICNDAVHQSLAAFACVPEKYKTPELCEYVFSNGITAYEEFPVAIRMNDAYIEKVILSEPDGYLFGFIPEVKITEAMVMRVVTDWIWLQTIPDKFKTPAVIMKMIENDWRTIILILNRTPEMIEAAKASWTRETKYTGLLADINLEIIIRNYIMDDLGVEACD